MANDPLTYEDLLRIVEILKASELFSEFRLKVGDIEVELRRRAPGTPSMIVAPTVEPASTRTSLSTSPVAPTEATPAPSVAPPATQSHPDPTQPVTIAPRAERASGGDDWPRDAIVIRAPMVGTFYRAPEPGARPFVAVGDRVGRDSVVCIIEVMKLMNSISAGAEGVITHILVDDAAPVESQAPLIVLAPGA